MDSHVVSIVGGNGPSEDWFRIDGTNVVLGPLHWTSRACPVRTGSPYSCAGNDDGMFKIDGCSGQVKVARAALDFETTKEYSLQVTVTDDGGVVPGPARLSASAVLTIRIVDVNEPPSLKDSAATVDENSAVGTAVGSALRGEDVDAGSVLSYAIASGNVGQVLALDSSSGVLSVQRAAIDFETTAKYVLNVTVTDNGKPSGPPLSSWGIVTVTVRDINEAPVIEDQQRSVNENSLAGQLVGSLLAASDVDAGNSLTFAIVGGQDAAAFLVSPVGQLTVATGAALDFETRSKLFVTVRVTDSDKVRPLSDEATITVQLVDVNEAPTLAEHTVVVAENSPIGFAIEGTASRARDVDADDVLSYAIVSQSPGSFFRMLSADGAVEVRQAGIDFETSAKHSLLVRVTDKAGLSAESQLHISVADVNEAPVIADQRRSVPENSPSTSCGLPLVATDVDAKDTPYSSPFAFSIVSSSAPGAFAIDPTSGVLSTTAAAELDHEAAPEAVVRRTPNFQEEVDIVSAADPDKADTLRFTLRVDSAPEGGQASDLGINPSTGKVFVARKTAAAVATPSDEHALWATIEGSDNDQDNELSYSILDGNYADTFKLTTVASASGHNYAELRVARPIIDFEDRTSYSLVVQVSDGFLKASAVVTVSVVDVNERPIIDAASLTLTVDENPASVGGVVGTVAARDVDADDLLTFAFFGDGNKAGHFAIDASTGAVSVASLDIDRETTSSYSIGVRVSDAGGLVDERQLSVLVNDVNDAPALADVVLQVPENLAPGAQVSSPLRVVDDDARDRHTFKMGRPNCWASQASTIGKYYFAPLAAKPSGSVQLGGAVRVRGAAQARIALSVMAPTDELYKAPTGFFYQLTVGALNNAHSTIEKCSPSCFQVASAPTPAALSTREFRSFWFSVSSQGLVTLGRGESEQLSEGLLVSFQDGADAAHGPALLPTRVGVAAASSALQFSSLCFDTAQSSAEGVFAVVEDGSVRIAAASPDFEAQREFGFEVLVTDSGAPAKQAAGVVMVQVQDVNERVTWATSSCLPGSAQAFAACLTVAENTLPGSAAAVLQSIAGMATDPDTLAKQALTFSVALDGNSFEGAKLFDVAPSTGVLSVKQDGLNHEQAAEWTLVVTATDNGTPQLSASALVHVAVEDVNEAPSLAAVVRTVAENSATGEVLVGGPILGSDVDAGQWGELAYAITGGSGSSVFGIEPSSGSLRVLNGTAGDLNFESLEKSKYQLVVRATDGGGLTARATVTVDVTDVNEAPVLFDAVRSVRENTLAPGKVGAPVTGTDPDNAHPVLGVRQQLLYSIVGGDGVALFKVDPCSGQLEVRDEASLNFEAKPVYTLTLQARDDVQPTPLTATATVTISLVDANDAPSIVVPPGGYVLQVEELAPVGTVLVSASGLVDRISATDEDVASATADWARLRWSLKSGNSLGIFDIDAVTGQVSVADFGRMDFENKDMNAFSLVAQVCDSGAPALCAETPVRVEVLNSNEPPRLEDASRAVNENTLSEAKLVAGQQLGLDLVASDPDGPSDEAKLRWRIESGDSLGFFSISEAGRAGSLVLTAAGAMGLNHEVVDSYTLVVSVTDAGGLSDTATVTVAVADLNERPILAAATFSINENSPRLSVVAGSASLATDEDADDSHTYEVVNQVPAGVFRVANARTGQLEVDEAVLDFEAVQSHRITMRVTDAGKLSAPDAVWTVNILDVQEPPSVVAAAFEGLPENSAAGVHVGTVKASDPDADDAGKLVFSITSQEENEDGVAPFAIDPSSGSLRVAESPTSEPVRLDFEGKNLFALTVSATDSKGNSASAAVTVRLSNVNEPPMLRENGTAIAAMENTVQDIRSIMDLVRDPDAGDAFRFEILSGDRCSSGAKVIKIDASTGVLSMVALGTCTQTYDPSTPQFKPNDVDFDNKFDLMIRITDSHLASTVNHLVIKLSNSNSRPRFVSRAEPFLLDENSAVGTLVGTVFAVDLNYQKQSLEYAVGPRGANVNRPFPFKMVTREATEQDRMALAQSDAGASVQLRQVGEILVDGPIDFEGEFSTYQMVVVATDSDSNLPLTGSMDVTVGVVNLNEPPTFVDGAVGGSAMFVVTVPENSVLGTALAGDKLVATDVDSADQGSVLRYSLEGEQAAVDLFQVDPISGAMVFKGSPTALNFENVAARAFELTAVVTDSASNAVRRPVQVRVLDVNEPPRFVGTSAFFFNVLEGSKFGTLVGSCAAVDDDAPTSARGQLRFSIAATDGTPSDDSALFEISQAGKLTVKQESLDWENQAEYSFVVTVTDGDADSPLSASRPVLVIVRDVNDISVDSFAALPADVAGGVAWDVDVDPATAAVPNMYNGKIVDWRVTHGTMDALSVTAGGARLVISGTNLGKTAARIAREKAASLDPASYPEDAYTQYEVTYGPVRGTKYAATNCSRFGGQSAPNTAIVCSTSEGAGVNHIWRVTVVYDDLSDVLPFSRTSSAKTGFAPPVVTSALIADASAAAFATQGGQRFVVRGQNFGPAFYARSSADGTGVESVPVTPIVRYGPVTGTENRAVDCAFVEGHTAIACDSVPGVGAGLKFVVSADGQSSEAFTSSLAYSPPTISRVSQLVLATQGGDEVTLFGDNFGPIGTAPIVAEYHHDLALAVLPDGFAPYRGVACQVAVDAPHRRITCRSSPGIGRNHSWRVSVGGQLSAVSGGAEGTSAYKPPVITKIGGLGADMADTKGGQQVLLSGANFGPVTQLDADGNVIAGLAPLAMYGRDGPSWPAYHARDCRVTVPHEQVVCITTEGTGRELVWELEIGAQRTARMLDMPTNYHPPVDCSVVTAHTLIQCTTDVGAGEDLTWSITVDEQASVSPTTDYHPPEITGFAGPAAADASTNGGQEIVIQGNYFSVGKYLQSVTYGPTGSEFAAHGCHVSVPHKEIRCQTVPGTGRVLRWVVTVKGQASPLSSVSTSYARPVINATTPGNSATNGGVLVRVTGQDFGVKWPLSELSVLLNAGGHATPAKAVMDAHFGSLWTGDSSARAAEVELWLGSLERPAIAMSGSLKDGSHYVDFEVPEGFGASRELLLLVDGVPSAVVPFRYDAPFITNIAPDRQQVETGLLRVFVEGESFCSGSQGCGSIKVDGVPVAPESWTHGQIMFIIPDPANADRELACSVEVDGVSSNVFYFKKPVPNFNALEGQGEWEDMKTVGGEEFFVAGVSDIDTVTDLTQIQVTFGDSFACPVYEKKAATPEEARDGKETIRCITPPGVGAGLPVLIGVPGGRSRASELTFSYSPPRIDSVVARDLDPDTNKIHSFVDAAENEEGGIPTAGAVAVVRGEGFGRPEFDSQRQFTLTSAYTGQVLPLAIISHSDSELVVTLPLGDGRRHPVEFVVGAQSSRLSGSPMVRYRRPSVASIGPGAPQAPTLGGQVVVIRGKDLGPTRPVVHLGPYNCTVLSSSMTAVECRTSHGQGVSLPVAVAVRDQTSDDGVRYSYNRPVVQAVVPAHGPTSGRTRPTISADRMTEIPGERLVVTVVGADLGTSGAVELRPSEALLDAGVGMVIAVPAEDVLLHNDTTIRFFMPEGFGEDLTVRVTVGGQASREAVTFSYDPPVVDGVSRADKDPAACQDRERVYLVNLPGGATREASRYVPAECFDTRGGYALLVEGESFGRSGAFVTIGGRECRVVSQTHNRITCEAPQGFGDRLGVHVSIGNRRNAPSAGAVFAYDPPIVTSLMPNTPDALGERVVIRGKNFGWEPTAVAITVNDIPCEGAEWLNDGSLQCSPATDVVGPKNVTILVANRTEPFVLYDFEEMFITECKAPLYYGLRGEECLKCSVDALGANCSDGDEQMYDLVVSLPGWWRFNYTTPHPACHEKRQARDECPAFAPCEPKWACLGANLCSEGYTSERCSQCVQGKYYRINGECEKCPDQPWLIFVLFFLAAAVLSFAAWMLNARQVNIAFVAIGVDYFQVLALFARARVRWPNILKGLFRWLSAFNLNIELAAPECAIPEVTFSLKWFLVMALPVTAAGMLLSVFGASYAYKTFIKRVAAKDRSSHAHALVSVFIVMMYVGYLTLTRMTLDVFNCSPTDPPDGNLYMSGMTDVVCFESDVHLTLFPFGLVAMVVYVAAYPLLSLLVLRRNKLIVKRDQVCRALAARDPRYKTREYMTEEVWLFRRKYNRLYYLFRPGKATYWIALILLRKFLIAFTALMFRSTPSYQLAFSLLVMFGAYALQVRNLPYMSPSDYDRTVRHHLLQAGIADTLHTRSDHWRIREEMTAVEEAYNPGGSRTGAWRDAALGAAVADLEEDKATNVSFAMFLVDYNAVESVLLACGVLVNLSGIMFLSNRFNDPELMSYYTEEYDQLAIAVATLILLSCVYFGLLLAFEVFFMLNPERAAWCVALCTTRAKREKMAKKISGEDDKTKARVSAGSSGSGAGDMRMAQSMLLTSRVSSDAVNADLAGGALESETLPDESQWAAVRAHAKSLQATFDDLREQVRQAQQHVHASETAQATGSSRGRSMRARKFAPRISSGAAANARSLLAKAAHAAPGSPASSDGRSSPRRSLVPMMGRSRGGAATNKPHQADRVPVLVMARDDGSFENPLATLNVVAPPGQPSTPARQSEAQATTSARCLASPGKVASTGRSCEQQG
ncbi:hypothetical protein FNF31_07613 [Cafeteria roenbergensis]|uniref:Cadherin domain-containing protein n=1 Tax=Cafeteria roenbergensis TaxID=33653 RepID=A0A5A8C3U4_CAFRO|nr:hypothetical protein FNF31_07613 [Cafeteria roenbergensis]